MGEVQSYKHQTVNFGYASRVKARGAWTPSTSKFSKNGIVIR